MQALFRTIEPPRDKTNKVSVRPAKTQISLGIRPVWSASSLCAQWVAKGPSFLHADSEASDHTGRMPRLIWVFAGRTTILLVLSWGGSIIQRYLCRKSAIINKVCGYSCMVNNESILLLIHRARWHGYIRQLFNILRWYIMHASQFFFSSSSFWLIEHSFYSDLL